MEEKKQVKKQEKNQLSVLQKDITDSVVSRINELQEVGALALPKTYAVGNELKMAWFALQEVKDRNDKPALEVCTKDSIANALLKMAIQGLSVWKKQGDFIVYGNKLSFEREYHGTIALALRTGTVTGVPEAEVIYEGDIFKYRIVNGKKEIIEHSQELENIDIEKIKGAYAVVPLKDGDFHTEVMTIQQIRQAWMQGAMKGKSGAHRNFTDQMAKKTVISRALKLYISSSDDEYLLGNEADPVQPEEKKETLEEVEFTEVEVVQDEPEQEEHKSNEPKMMF
ncbi:MAG: recombinase RecT [Fermentimonas sp.]|nr:recombinase RecT [Fermentimonas sp.]